MMKTIMTLGLVGAIAVLGGCGAPQGVPSIELVGPEAIQLPTAVGKDCTWPAGKIYYNGAMDVMTLKDANNNPIPPAYTFSYPFLIQNKLQFDTTTSPTGTSTFDFLGEKVVAKYLGQDDATTTALSGLHAEIPETIPVSAGGKEDADMVIIPPNVGKAIAGVLNVQPGASKVVLVQFHLTGVLENGSQTSTNDIQYPVYVCDGCVDNAGCPSGYVKVSCGVEQTPYGCVKSK